MYLFFARRHVYSPGQAGQRAGPRPGAEPQVQPIIRIRVQQHRTSGRPALNWAVAGQETPSAATIWRMTTEMEGLEMTPAPYELVLEPGGVLARINAQTVSAADRGNPRQRRATFTGDGSFTGDGYWMVAMVGRR